MMNRFHFRGFQPTPELQRHSDLALGELLELAPPDASSLGSVEFTPEGYVARLDVYSKQGPFLADRVALSPQEALDLVMAEIRTQLNQWKERKDLEAVLQGRRDHYLNSVSL